MKLIIRKEKRADEDAVRALNQLAFSSVAEAALVDDLRDKPDTISLVADEQGKIVGHIFFSAVTISTRTNLK
ncbi:MAG: GNAT family N-acetyltransferase, partial [Gammaproteobacteria bacterium]